MLQCVVSKTYVAWLAVASVALGAVSVSLFYPVWMWSPAVLQQPGSERCLASGVTHNSVSPLAVCQTFCVLTIQHHRCDWLWTEIILRLYTSSLYDLLIFTTFLVATISLALAFLILLFAGLVRDLRGVSLFKVSGIFFFVSAIFLVLLMLCWLLTWSNTKFRSVCGIDAQVFQLHKCKTGWAVYTFSVSLLLILVAGILANFVDKSICNEQVEEHLLMSDQINFV